MKFLVEASGNSDRVARAEGEVVFHIFSEAYWDPLVVVSNNSLLVEESTSIAITAYDLQVGRREREEQVVWGNHFPLMNAFSPPLFVHLGGGRVCLLGEEGDLLAKSFQEASGGHLRVSLCRELSQQTLERHPVNDVLSIRQGEGEDTRQCAVPN